MAPKPTPTSRESWILEGMRALGDGGPGSVRIELLAKALGLTKGSFYWHFKDRRAFLEELLDVWERRGVDEVIERVESEGGTDARALLVQLYLTASVSSELRSLGRAELAIREWARHDSAVAGRLRRVDNRRMDYMRSLFSAFCPDPEEVEARCMIAFSLFVASDFIAAQHRGRSRPDVVRQVMLRLLD